MKKYIQVARLDHWIKQLFIFPGLVVAYVLLNPKINIYIVCKIIFGFISTCLIASSNYIINEWLDAEFDKFHPTKKYRSVVENDLRPAIVYILYFGLAIIGVGIAFCLSPIFCGCEIWLWVMGILYNVKPIRTKDIPIIDILSESINNAIRFLLGWFTITDSYLPPISIIINVNNLTQATTTYCVFTFNWHGVPCAFLHSRPLSQLKYCTYFSSKNQQIYY